MKDLFTAVDAFKNYDNILGFYVTHYIFSSGLDNVPAYVRALLRDTKEYISKNSPRTIPVGLALNVGIGLTGPEAAITYNTIKENYWHYLQCTTNPHSNESDSSRADFLSFPNFDWCPGNGTLGATNGTFNQQWNSSGWQALERTYRPTSIPLFLGGYGCVNYAQPQNRDFHDTAALYNDSYMAMTFSGGFLYQWANVQMVRPLQGYYPLVNIDPGGMLQVKQDFDTFSNVLGQFNLPALGAGLPAMKTVVPDSCTATLIDENIAIAGNSHFVNNWTLPTVPPGVPNLILNGNNGSTGKSVDVIQTSVSHIVKDVDGSTMQGLAITPIPSSLGKPLNTGRPLNSSSTAPSITSNQRTSGRRRKLGLAIGLPLGLLLLATLGALLIWKRRKERKARESAKPKREEYQGKPELENTVVSGSGGFGKGLPPMPGSGPFRIPELVTYGHGIHELATHEHQVQELDGGYRATELKGCTQKECSVP
ncbi:MAG: hypothetical protein Q9187_008518 [Circinaria calcarea]